MFRAISETVANSLLVSSQNSYKNLIFFKVKMQVNNSNNSVSSPVFLKSNAVQSEVMLVCSLNAEELQQGNTKSNWVLETISVR